MHEGLKFSHKDMANKYPRVFWVFSQNAIHCVVKTCVFLKLKALISAGNIALEEALHIGDSIVKDYEADKSTGMLALSLGRFKTPEAVESRNSGAVVLPDLKATQE
jgi:hypothetical protein